MWESGRKGSQKDRQGNRGLRNCEQHSIKISEKNKQATGCQALAQQRYFPLRAQLDLWVGEQYSPVFSQTLTQVGEFSFSMTGRYKNSMAELNGGSLTRKHSIGRWSPSRHDNLSSIYSQWLPEHLQYCKCNLFEKKKHYEKIVETAIG